MRSFSQMTKLFYFGCFFLKITFYMYSMLFTIKKTVRGYLQALPSMLFMRASMDNKLFKKSYF